jgi:nucleotide-binding universal stress UspA family protein
MAWLVGGKVLVPFDFDGFCKHAVDLAIECTGDPSRVILLHVSPFLMPVDSGAIYTDIDPADRLNASLKAMQQEFSEDRYRGMVFEVALGDPSSVVCKRADELKVDLVIVPSHGRKGLKRLLLGSVAEAIVRQVHCPILVVKQT